MLRLSVVQTQRYPIQVSRLRIHIQTDRHTDWPTTITRGAAARLGLMTQLLYRLTAKYWASAFLVANRFWDLEHTCAFGIYGYVSSGVHIIIIIDTSCSNYHITGKFGGSFNLAIWWIWPLIAKLVDATSVLYSSDAKLKSANYVQMAHSSNNYNSPNFPKRRGQVTVI